MKWVFYCCYFKDLTIFTNKLSHENKKAVSPFYHKNIFDRKWMQDTRRVSIKNNFYNKMDLRFFIFTWQYIFILWMYLSIILFLYTLNISFYYFFLLSLMLLIFSRGTIRYFCPFCAMPAISIAVHISATISNF